MLQRRRRVLDVVPHACVHFWIVLNALMQQDEKLPPLDPFFLDTVNQQCSLFQNLFPMSDYINWHFVQPEIHVEVVEYQCVYRL